MDGASPEFLELCPACERKIRARAAEKIRLAELRGKGMECNAVKITVLPGEDFRLILEPAWTELEDEVGLAYLNQRA